MLSKITAVLALAGSTLLASAQTDGNPHNWDRQRRCDNVDYDPPCGLCEGVGGDVWSDKNEDIKITACEPVALAADLPADIQADYPKLPKLFTQSGHHEVFITDKTNPFCKGGFPGPDSTKDHCYQRQEGSFIYDWENYRLKMHLNVGGPLNTTSDITHVKGQMWIVNDLGAGVNQCICTEPGERFGFEIYPLRYDFMNPARADVRFIGRENLFIEFLERTMEVDHWTQGPHHLWIDTATRQIVRMWQPWNGLEIWDPATWSIGEDNSAEFEIPPSHCIPSWHRWTIKCGDDGYHHAAAETSIWETLLN